MSFSVPLVAKIKVFGPEKALINEPTFEIIISIKRKKKLGKHERMDEECMAYKFIS